MMNRKLSILVVVSVITVMLLGAFAGGMILYPYVMENAQAAQTVAETTAQPVVQIPAVQGDILAAYEQSLSALYQQSVPAVVYIEVAQKLDTPVLNFDLHPFLNPDDPDSPDDFFNRGQGSGFVWDTAGHIVTNYHVVNGATEITVRFADDTTVKAELLGSDPNADLAVIKVDLPASQLQPLPIGNSDVLEVGQLAVAIGNPFGQDFTMTSGIVSAIGRTIRSGNTPFSIPEVVQTDAPINPGNSGGPLLNRLGEVIGINTQIISSSGGSSGIGFAVPINIAKQVVPTLIQGKQYDYAWLGITGRTVSPEMAGFMDLPLDTRGALVIDVTSDGPAAKAGLKGSDGTQTEAGLEFQLGGDVITAINGQTVDDMDGLITYLMTETRPGDEAELTIIHADGSTETITVTLQKRPSAEELLSRQDDDEDE